jgi:hypothetical protein
MSAPKVNVELLSGTLGFDYIKSSHFRVIHVDGVHGGVRPSGRSIHMALFSERNAIPQHEDYRVQDGRLGEKVRSDGRESIVREVEVDAILDLNAARVIRDWLTNMIVVAEAAALQLPKDES